MSAAVVSYLLSNKDMEKRLQCHLILQCAPLLKGIKVASIINLEKEGVRQLSHVLAGTGIVYRVLGAGRGKYLVFLYRREKFASYLLREEVREFLEVYGYESGDMDEILRHLSRRVRRYAGENRGFPHEIGAFLDYPIDDVRCFIERGGRDCVLSGYWKVYNNPVRAGVIFLAYDRAKTRAVNEFLMGRSLKDIVCRAAEA